MGYRVLVSTYNYLGSVCFSSYSSKCAFSRPSQALSEDHTPYLCHSIRLRTIAMTTHKEGTEYDIIFAGGGTAACVAAGRLAKADPNLSILLVEGGKNNLNDPTVINPAIFLSHLAPGSQTALFYQSNKEKALNDREAIVPSGGILGGGSSINFMMYTRGKRKAPNSNIETRSDVFKQPRASTTTLGIPKDGMPKACCLLPRSLKPTISTTRQSIRAFTVMRVPFMSPTVPMAPKARKMTCLLPPSP